MTHMRLFSRHTSMPGDLRDRDYLLTGCPLIAQDNYVVLVDVTVRLAVRAPTEERPLVKGYDPRRRARRYTRSVSQCYALWLSRCRPRSCWRAWALETDTIERGFGYAPVGTDLNARVLSVEVPTYDPNLVKLAHEFRIVAA